MKQTIQWKNKSIQFDIGLILILILFGMTSCFALYNSFNLIKSGSGNSYLLRQLFWFVVGFITMFILSNVQNKKNIFLYECSIQDIDALSNLFVLFSLII